MCVLVPGASHYHLMDCSCSYAPLLSEFPSLTWGVIVNRISLSASKYMPDGLYKREEAISEWKVVAFFLLPPPAVLPLQKERSRCR